MGKLDRFTEWVYNFYYKFLVSYALGLVCWAATVMFAPYAPIWPVNYYTLVWVLAFFFPGSAFLYGVFNLRVRFNEIQDIGEHSQYYYVYSEERQKEKAAAEFYRYLRRRFAEYYNVLELAAFALVAGMVTFLGGFFLAIQLWIPEGLDPVSDLLPDVIPPWVLATGASFLGAFAGALVLVFKRYRTFDIYPSTYLQVSVGIVVGTLSGGLLVAIWPRNYTSFLAFAAAFLTVTNINFLTRLLRDEFARLTNAKLPPEIPTDLDRVLRNSEAIESLTSVSLISVAEFAKTDPIRLYLNMSQPIGVINGWVDEALLHYYFEDRVDDLRKAHVRRFTQLLEMLVDQYVPGGIRWKAGAVITGDTGIDAGLARTVQTIVSSRVHHRVLGLLAENYRRAYFVPDGMAAGG